MRRAVAALAAGVVALTLAGCGGSGGGRDDGLGSGFSVSAALHELPAVEGTAKQPTSVYAVDLDRATKLAGLPEPKNEQTLDTWSKGLDTAPLYVPLTQNLGSQFLLTGMVRKILGFELPDVATYASVENRPGSITVARLHDGARLKKGVTATGKGKPGAPDLSGGVTGSPFPFVLGVHADGDRVALAQRTALLDAWEKGDTSLASDGELADLAKALDEQHVYAAWLLGGPAPTQSKVSAAQLAEAPVPAFDAVGVGEGIEGGEEVEYVAYRVDDAAGSKAAIEALWSQGRSVISGQPLVDLATVDKVSASGHVVLLRISPRKQVGIAIKMLQQGDLPFLKVP